MNEEYKLIYNDFKLNKYKMNMHFWLIFILIGGFMNMSAVVFNDGLMPVYIEEDILFPTDTHSFYTDKSDVNHWHLTDWIDLYFYMVSPGDILMILGFVFFLINVGFFSYYLIKFRSEKL